MSDIERYSKFTQPAWQVLVLAQEEAEHLHHNYIGTEHLLLGLISEGEGLAARVLHDLDVELVQVRSRVEFIITRKSPAFQHQSFLGQIRSCAVSIIGRRSCKAPHEAGFRLTGRVKKVLELAADEAQRLKHDYVGPEHLLLGMIREGEGIGADVLDSLGVDLKRARTQTLRELGQQ